MDLLGTTLIYPPLSSGSFLAPLAWPLGLRPVAVESEAEVSEAEVSEAEEEAAAAAAEEEAAADKAIYCFPNKDATAPYSQSLQPRV